MTHKRHGQILLLVAVFAVVLVVFQSAAAQVKSFRWEDWESDITLLENGDFAVEETHTLEFSGEPFTFGFRTIRTGASGGNDAIKNISVREGDINYTQSNSQEPHTYTVSRDGDEITIRWYFDPALGRKTYTFSYTVEGGVSVGVGQEGTSDEIFWTIIPDDHPGLVSSSKATIHLPEGVQPQRYTGTSDYIVAGYNNNNQSDTILTQVSDDGQTITYENTQPLVQGQSFEVRTQFASGLLDIPQAAWQRQQQIGDTISLILLVISLLLCVVGPLLILLLWYFRGRDPQLTVVVPEYISEPPENLPPAVVGTLIDEKADMQDIVSTLIDLANRGYITMTEEKNNHIFTRTGKDQHDLLPFEKQFLKDIFDKKDERSLNDLRYKFSSKLPNLRNMVYQELVDENLVPASPHSVRRSYGCFAGLLFAGAVASFFILTALLAATVETVDTIACIPFTFGLTALLMLIAARYMPKKTAKGTEAAAKWNAFKNYLQNIERYADLEESSDIFANYLGYAVAFGLERTWIRKFSAAPLTPIPGWYIPYYGGHYGGFGGGTSSGSAGSGSPQVPTLQGMSGGLTGGLAGMSSGLTRMLNSTSSVLKSTPPSSRSGGSGGGFSGGFSGGGFSGGGGSAGFG